MKQVNMEIPGGSFALLNKPNAKGEKCIYFRYCINRKYVKRSVDIWIKPEDWDAKSQTVKSSHPNAARINNRLNNLKVTVDAKLLVHDGPITSDVLKKYMDGDERNKVIEAEQQKQKLPTIIEYALEVNNHLYNKSHFGYSTWYNKKKCIEAFEFFILNIEKEQVPHLDELKLDLFDRYISYRKNILKNGSAEAMNKTLVPLYAAIRYAVDNGVIEQKNVVSIINNYIPVKSRKYTSDTEEERVRYLTPEQMRRLWDYSQTIYRESTRKIMDLFFFAYYACGMRISDIITLEWKHIDFQKCQIVKRQVKTKQEAGVPTPLSPKAMEILYRWKARNCNDRFVFNLLDEDFNLDDERALMIARNTKDKTFNKSLQAVSKNAKMPFNVTMHTARHSFAVHAINNGISLYLLSKLMGHASIITTEKIYARFLEEKVSEEVQCILDMDLSKARRYPQEKRVKTGNDMTGFSQSYQSGSPLRT